MESKYKSAMNWLDSQLYEIEQTADIIGYDHENNQIYKNIVRVMGEIEFNNKSIKPEDWLKLGMEIQILWQQVKG